MVVRQSLPTPNKSSDRCCCGVGDVVIPYLNMLSHHSRQVFADRHSLRATQIRTQPSKPALTSPRWKSVCSLLFCLSRSHRVATIIVIKSGELIFYKHMVEKWEHLYMWLYYSKNPDQLGKLSEWRLIEEHVRFCSTVVTATTDSPNLGQAINISNQEFGQWRLNPTTAAVVMLPLKCRYAPANSNNIGAVRSVNGHYSAHSTVGVFRLCQAVPQVKQRSAVATQPIA